MSTNEKFYSMGFDPTSQFCCSDCSNSGHWELFGVVSIPLRYVCPYPFFSTLLTGTSRQSRLIFYLICLNSGINHLFKELWLPLLENDIQKAKSGSLGVLIATGVSLVLGPLSRQSQGMYVYMYLPIRMFPYIFLKVNLY